MLNFYFFDTSEFCLAVKLDFKKNSFGSTERSITGAHPVYFCIRPEKFSLFELNVNQRVQCNK